MWIWFFFFFFGLTLRDKLVHQLHKTSMKNDLIIACSLQHRREPAYSILSSMWASSKANLRKHLCISKAKIYSLHVNSKRMYVSGYKSLTWIKKEWLWKVMRLYPGNDRFILRCLEAPKAPGIHLLHVKYTPLLKLCLVKKKEMEKYKKTPINHNY